MNDRDHFAAAALSGMLGRPDIDDEPLEYHFLCEHAYKWADAMLRERERGVAQPMPKEKRAEVSKQEPVAWAVVRPDGEIVDTFVSQGCTTRVVPQGFGIQPLYLTPQPALADAEREAIVAGLGALERLYEDSPPISKPIYEQHAPTLRSLLTRLA